MSDRANRFFLALAILGIPYAIAATHLLEPMVISGRINIVLALLAISTPTVLGALGTLISTPRR